MQSLMRQLSQNPQVMQSILQAMQANPEMMNSMIDANPMFAGNPEMQEYMRTMMPTILQEVSHFFTYRNPLRLKMVMLLHPDLSMWHTKETT